MTTPLWIIAIILAVWFAVSFLKKIEPKQKAQNAGFAAAVPQTEKPDWLYRLGKVLASLGFIILLAVIIAIGFGEKQSASTAFLVMGTIGIILTLILEVARRISTYIVKGESLFVLKIPKITKYAFALSFGCALLAIFPYVTADLPAQRAAQKAAIHDKEIALSEYNANKLALPGAIAYANTCYEEQKNLILANKPPISEDCRKTRVFYQMCLKLESSSTDFCSKENNFVSACATDTSPLPLYTSPLSRTLALESASSTCNEQVNDLKSKIYLYELLNSTVSR
jgi:hypothetical protein